MVEELADGALVIEMPFAGTSWLVREVLKGAGDMVVLEPDDAREAVLEAVTDKAEQGAGAVEEPAVEAPGHPAIVRVRAHNPGPMTLDGHQHLRRRQLARLGDRSRPRRPRPHRRSSARSAETRGGIGGVLLTHSHSDHNAGVGMLGAPLVVRQRGGLRRSRRDARQRAGRDAAGARQRAGRVGPFTVAPDPGPRSRPRRLRLRRGLLLRRPRPRRGLDDRAAGRGRRARSPTTCARSSGSRRSASTLLCPGPRRRWITDPAAKIAEYAAHRRERERLLVEALDAGKRERRASSSTRPGPTSPRRCAPPRRSRCGPTSRSSPPRVGSPGGLSRRAVTGLTRSPDAEPPRSDQADARPSSSSCSTPERIVVVHDERPARLAALDAALVHRPRRRHLGLDLREVAEGPEPRARSALHAAGRGRESSTASFAGSRSRPRRS